jgi:pyruvate-formate lyase-activating enzyme
MNLLRDLARNLWRNCQTGLGTGRDAANAPRAAGAEPSLEQLFARVPAEQLDHLVYALQKSGELAKLKPSQRDFILNALGGIGAGTQPVGGTGGGRKAINMNIDIVGACNLRCPSCPVGNTGAINPSGLMKLDLFKDIVRKAHREYELASVYLFNWTEPFLHPELPAFIAFVRSLGLQCGVSSNLNKMTNIEEVIAAKPNAFRISLSGFSQEVYGQSHARGDIERVKRNMKVLSDTVRKQPNCETGVHVFFHKYRHNLGDIAPMRELTESLGFEWSESWAYLMPLEKCIDLEEGRLPADQLAFVEKNLAIPMLKVLPALKHFKNEPCAIIEDLTIDVEGHLNLCCATYDASKNRIGYFLDTTPASVERSKTGHSLCDRCTKSGFQNFFTYFLHPKLQPIVEGLTQLNLLQIEAPPEPGRVALPLLADNAPVG